MAPVTDDTKAEPSDEVVRKIYARDVAIGSQLRTVFRADTKERHRTRAGKEFLTIRLVDKTGALPAKVFDSVEAAFGAFDIGDYLLVSGRVGVHQNNTQLVVEHLERLDPEPIDARDFAYQSTPPAPEARRALSRRIARLLEVPEFVQALEALLLAVERHPDARPKRLRRSARPNAPAPIPALSGPTAPSGMAFKPFKELVDAPPLDKSP